MFCTSNIPCCAAAVVLVLHIAVDDDVVDGFRGVVMTSELVRPPLHCCDLTLIFARSVSLDCFWFFKNFFCSTFCFFLVRFCSKRTRILSVFIVFLVNYDVTPCTNKSRSSSHSRASYSISITAFSVEEEERYILYHTVSGCKTLGNPGKERTCVYDIAIYASNTWIDRHIVVSPHTKSLADRFWTMMEKIQFSAQKVIGWYVFNNDGETTILSIESHCINAWLVCFSHNDGEMKTLRTQSRWLVGGDC